MSSRGRSTGGKRPSFAASAPLFSDGAGVSEELLRDAGFFFSPALLDVARAVRLGKLFVTSEKLLDLDGVIGE